MLSKLPEETKRNMARNHQRGDWTVQELQAGLRNEIRVFEVGQPSPYNSPTGLPPTASFITSTRKPHYKKDSINKLCCVYCKGSHSAVNCDTHTEVPAHVEIIKQQRLCFNCLAHHRVTNCNSKNHWNKHHTSICTDSSNKQTNSPAATVEKTAPVLQTSTLQQTNATDNGSFTTLAPSKHSSCLLKTAIATVVGAGSQLG